MVESEIVNLYTCYSVHSNNKVMKYEIVTYYIAQFVASTYKPNDGELEKGAYNEMFLQVNI